MSSPILSQPLLSLVERDRTSSRKAVCVIENISPACIETTGTAWAIEPDFFAMHASNPLQLDLWQPCDWKPNPAPASKQHLDGVCEYKYQDIDLGWVHSTTVNCCNRHIFKDGAWQVNVSTRMSYCQPLANVCKCELTFNSGACIIDC